MKIFDKSGRMKIPEPAARVRVSKSERILRECFCHNGHSLLSRRALFDSEPGVLLLLRFQGQEGYLALSPFANDKRWISVGTDIVPGEKYELLCPECHEVLPAFAPCPCGGSIVVMKAGKKGEFIGICNVAACPNALIIPDEELMTRAGLFL